MISRCPSGALCFDHVHENAHIVLDSPSGRDRWDGSHFPVPKSPLGHTLTPGVPAGQELGVASLPGSPLR